MQMPGPSASYDQYVHFGRYLASRLRRDRMAELVGEVDAVTAAVKAAGRAWEDSKELVEDALAARDAGAADLDRGAQAIRLDLASRKLGAHKEAPYTEVFPAGIEAYTTAPVDARAGRFRELLRRLAAALPADDRLLATWQAPLTAGVDTWSADLVEVERQRTGVSMAATALASAKAAWRAAIERAYGRVVAAHGRRDAEAFFPKRRRVKEAAVEPAAVEPSAREPSTPEPSGDSAEEAGEAPVD